MLENDHSNLQTKFGVHIASNNFQNNTILKSRDRTNPPLPRPPIFENLPYPRGRWWVRNFFAKMRGKDELKGTRSNFTPWLHIFSTFQHLTKTYPTPGEGGGFKFFFAKMRGKDELKGTRSNFTPWLHIFSTFQHLTKTYPTPGEGGGFEFFSLK